VDRLRAEAVRARTEPLLVVDAQTHERAQRVMADPGDLVVTDERLRLVLLAAHPSLAPEAAAALTLRLVLGVSTADLARLFLVSKATMAARLTRARTKLVTAGVAFAVPEGEALAERVEVVATVAYLAFTAGYAPGSGPDVVRVDLAGEAIRLVRVLRTLVPYAVPRAAAADASAGDSPSPTAILDLLLALMLLQHSRRAARTSPDGDLVLLPDQDRSVWHRDEIDEGLSLMSPYRGDLPMQVLGRRARELLLQALIAACHATAPTAADTDWGRIVGLYGELETLTGSPVVRLNRAIAVAQTDGPEAGLALLAGLDEHLLSSHRLPAARAELLARTGRHDEARAAYERAIALCDNEAERTHLQRRLSGLG
jgi:predicted RNA polymerase sigma factor